MPRPRSAVADASALISSAIATSFSFLSGSRGDEPTSTAEEVFDGEIDLKDDEILEQERGEEGEADDSPDLQRRVRVLKLAGTDSAGIGEQARLRRMWEVVPLRQFPSHRR
jgi:hypothetical protein